MGGHKGTSEGMRNYVSGGSDGSLLDELYHSIESSCPDNGWWDKFGPTLRNAIFSELLAADSNGTNGDGKGKKLDGSKSFLLYTEPMKYFINDGVCEFLDAAMQMGYDPDIRLHRPSDAKTDIGYDHKEVAITLAYATDDRSTNFLVFTRNRPEKVDGRIPRLVLKKLLGVKDTIRAADRAEKNLKGRMKKGDMGPLGLMEGDKVYFDTSSYIESEMNPGLKSNFSTGNPMLSFNMNLTQAKKVLTNLYPRADVQIKELWNKNQYTEEKADTSPIS